MKRAIFLVGVLMTGLISNPLKATHFMAGDLTYKHIAGNDYLVTLAIFGDCCVGCALLPDSVEVEVTSSCGNFLLTVFETDSIHLNSACNSQPSYCFGGVYPGSS